MKTIEIVNTVNGCFVTRRYCGMNKGRQFFTNVAPDSMKKREAKAFLAKVAQDKDEYIRAWVG